MVSLRSGKRTNRVSTGAVTSQPLEPAEESTPKRPTRGRQAAVVQKVFDDVAPNLERESSSSSVEEIVPSPPTQASPIKDIVLSPKKNVAPSPVKSDSFDSINSESNQREPSPDVFDSDEVVDDSTKAIISNEASVEEENEVEMTEEPEVITLDDEEKTEEVQEENNEDEEDVEEEDDDDDMPMEVSSKKEAPKPEKEVSDSDDEPMEVTSKVVPEVPQKSVVEQLLEKKASKAAKLAEKKLKKRSKNKKKESKKVDEGFYQVKMKKSKAKFNVVTLKSGVQKMLEPQVNFREQLLQARTAGTRVDDSNKFQQRAKWVAKRS